MTAVCLQSEPILGYQALTGIAWDAYAVSIKALVGGGSLLLSVPLGATAVLVGVDEERIDGGPSENYQQLTYGLFFSHGWVTIRERNVAVAGPFSYGVGDLLRIERRGAQVRYLLADTLLHTSVIPSSDPLWAHAFLGGAGDEVTSAAWSESAGARVELGMQTLAAPSLTSASALVTFGFDLLTPSDVPGATIPLPLRTEGRVGTIGAAPIRLAAIGQGSARGTTDATLFLPLQTFGVSSLSFARNSVIAQLPIRTTIRATDGAYGQAQIGLRTAGHTLAPVVFDVRLLLGTAGEPPDAPGDPSTILTEAANLVVSTGAAQTTVLVWAEPAQVVARTGRVRSQSRVAAGAADFAMTTGAAGTHARLVAVGSALRAQTGVVATKAQVVASPANLALTPSSATTHAVAGTKGAALVVRTGQVSTRWLVRAGAAVVQAVTGSVLTRVTSWLQAARLWVQTGRVSAPAIPARDDGLLYVVNPATGAVSTLLVQPLALAVHQGVLYWSDGVALYQMRPDGCLGWRDVLIEFGDWDFGGAMVQIPEIELEIGAVGAVKLDVTHMRARHTRRSHRYRLVAADTAVQWRTVKLGRGPLGRHWSVRLSTEHESGSITVLRAVILITEPRSTRS